MVRDYREAEGASLYSSTGVNMGGNGALAFWIQEVINAVSGNLDRRGGTLLGQGILDFGRLGRRSGFGLSSEKSRIGGFTAVNDAFPGGLLADEILTPGERQVRALFFRLDQNRAHEVEGDTGAQGAQAFHGHRLEAQFLELTLQLV